VTESALRVALLYPELLGTYGDRGNARVLVQRLLWRGRPAELVEVNRGDVPPSSCDIYLLGGGEDSPQAMAAVELAVGGPLERAVADGAAVLAVCAGYQILGHTFCGPEGVPLPGLGLIDCTTVRGEGPRVVGEILVEPSIGTAVPLLSGYENHAGLTRLGAEARPLGSVRAGVGNGDGTEGAVSGRVVGTYLHGPVLARNPALADLMLSWFVDHLEPLDDTDVARLRQERRQAVDAAASRWSTGRTLRRASG
jgi:lipid II isoglutaminyl synthase (glutamine-hydrolysing)